MAIDIYKAITANAIKHGNTTVKTGKTTYQTYDEYVNNKPEISTIESKYDARFDDEYSVCIT